MLEINGAGVKDPTTFTWGLQDISTSEAGRTEDTIMHKNRVGQKRKLSVSWVNPTPQETASILQAVNPEYINIMYPDAMSGTNEIRTFYVGDRTAPIRAWTVNYKRYTSLTFDLIER
ncbi:hypothetical protein [uncultured Robinsoniella sp.]|uniref:hypothetical protein n=1 Tax=uncultured Robinsoniella sp. TaxID=904190 RepID=UPI002063CF5E|nr:MAG TPA: hypothetical protein [Caudoviricetes sp.]